MRFRKMEAGDLDSAVALEAECFSRPWQRRDFEDALKGGCYLYYVAEEDEELCAQAGLICTPPEADISNVAVKKEYRRRGVAIELLRYLLQAGREAGIREFTLEVRASNMPAIALYEKMGFVCEGRRKAFYSDPREDALIYWLREES